MKFGARILLMAGIGEIMFLAVLILVRAPIRIAIGFGTILNLVLLAFFISDEIE